MIAFAFAQLAPEMRAIAQARRRGLPFGKPPRIDLERRSEMYLPEPEMALRLLPRFDWKYRGRHRNC